MDKVRCKDCGWEGDTDELAVNYLMNRGEVIQEPRCPKCGSFWVEDFTVDVSAEIVL